MARGGTGGRRNTGLIVALVLIGVVALGAIGWVAMPLLFGPMPGMGH
jgi:hypothetical protein